MLNTPTSSGIVSALWRYPVKSMRGEEMNAVDIGTRGLLGDRAYAILDRETGKVASAKNPKKWPNLFDCRALFVAPPVEGHGIPAVEVMLPDGTLARSDENGFDSTLSSAIGRAGTLVGNVPDDPILEEYWPDMEELDRRDEVTDESMPAATFFDLATIHVLTTGTLAGLAAAHPEGRFEPRRFRPNVIVTTPPQAGHFPENDWVGRTLQLGDEVLLRITGPCPRCVMTTLPQSDLPRDPGILRAAARHNDAHVGIYAEVVQGGQVTRGETVTLVD
jgi:uncharacterized protein YcbX